MATYNPLQSVVLTSTTTSVVFSGIPQDYTDLVIVVDGTTNTNSYFTLRFNNDTTSLYSNTEMDGSGSAASTNRNSGNSYMYNGSINTTQSNIITQINNYSNSTTSKSAISRSNYTQSGVKASVGLWRSSAAITSVECGTGGSNTFQPGSTFSLYGISPVNAKVTSASGGTDIFYDSTYVYHVFKGSGIFTPNRALTADILVVAGGGGGGQQSGGGGGAGGLLAFTSQSLTAQAYTCTVGAAGSGSVTTSAGSTGSDSQFGALTLVKGGGGGGSQGGTNAGQNGGSGGGGTYNTGAGGSPTTSQGFGGGSGNSSAGAGGGGGGAGAAGTNAVGFTSGVGGIGLYSTFTDAIGTATGLGQLVSSHYYFAGGGGGGNNGGSGSALGGSGGGGRGGQGGGAPITAVSGTSNTGGGGGGGNDVPASGTTGASGGSGVVIVRYAR